ncbi:hypothetical protein [Bradyrhizobium sp.]|uniref:hypothetical protein n=1 Tax=Bradyrhizobium sp. TaxID=376 RepID=UPI0025C1D67B|nr:hypothetical protein [Bradyrhizobium sp.]
MGSPRPAAAVLAALVAATALPAHAEGRAELVTCQAMVDRAAQAPASAQPDEAALARCRQIIRDWTLRESRMSVDENGKPLR